MKHITLLHLHLKHHHKKYLFGTFGSFAIIKTVLLFAGFFGLIHLADIFAIGTATNVSITGASLVGQTLTGVYTYVDAPWEAVGSPRFSADMAMSNSLAINGSGTPYVGYSDYASAGEATVMKFNGTNWEAVGTPRFSDSMAAGISLALNGAGVPYVAYADYSSMGEMSVMKFNGTSWEAVGSPRFSDGEVGDLSLAINGAGVPYVAYKDLSSIGEMTVMKFNGTSWEAVGSPRFSAANTYYTSLALDGTGTPYVAYSDVGNSYKITVMKFNGTSWEAVGGSPGISSGQADHISLTLDGAGNPYVAYEDYGCNKATAMKFNGTDREIVGTQGFSSGQMESLSSFMHSGTLYVAYTDTENSLKATLMKFNGTNREVVGVPGFSDNQASYTSLSVYNGVPYIAYSDGATYKATVMRYRPDTEGTSLYQRYRDTVVITGATGLLYIVAPEDAGTTLNFEVTPVSSGGRAGLPVSSADNYIPAPSAESVTITGSLIINEILTGMYTYTDTTSGGVDPEGTSFYQWYRNDVAITGATGLTYRAITGDAGMTIKFEVTPISLAGAPGTAVKSNGLIINSFPTAIEVTIHGTPNSNQTLTGSYTYFDKDMTWEIVGSPGFSVNRASYTDLFVYSGISYVVYSDQSVTGKATVMKFNGSNREAVGILGFSSGSIMFPSLFMYSGILYVAYQDSIHGYKATVMKFNGTNREPVGSLGFTSGPAYYTSLFVDSGVIYVAYSDYTGDLQQATVMKFNGTGWEDVGSPRFSDGPANSISFYIESGILYVAYSDYYSAGQATVMKFNGTSWEAVGTPRFSDGRADSPSLFVYSGVSYIAYADQSTGGKATVMKFNGTSRETVSVKGFSEGSVTNISLYIYDGILYVAYEDSFHDNKVTVMKFNGTNREFVGIPGFSELGANHTSFFVYSGTPYIAYADRSGSGKATVMKAIPTDLEGTSSYQWYRNDTAITGATGLTYTLVTGDAGKTIKFEVIPFALSGSSPGIAVQSTGLLINGGQGGGGDIGGGGGGILPKDVCTPDRDCSSSYYDHICGPCSSTGETHTSAVSCTAYSDELNSAYIFAYDNGITTIKNCIGADLQGNLIRSHMAKMVSQFAIKVLKMKPDTKKTSCTFPDMHNESKEMQFYATIACQLGLMGLDTDGVTPKATFDPNDTVDRAQFGTILSRILRGTKYAGGLPFYVKHLNALKKEAIMNDITRPIVPEMRGRVMLMLQRSAGGK